MPSINHKRKESILFREVSGIISEELTNSNMSYPTVTSVKLSNDQSLLTIYVTFENNQEKSFQILHNTQGYIRNKLSRLSGFRKTPKIKFKIDEAILHGRRIEEILKSVK